MEPPLRFGTTGLHDAGPVGHSFDQKRLQRDAGEGNGAGDEIVSNDLSWRKDEWIATDVRPENALLAEADGSIRAIDFIVGRI